MTALLPDAAPSAPTPSATVQALLDRRHGLPIDGRWWAAGAARSTLAVGGLQDVDRAAARRAFFSSAWQLAPGLDNDLETKTVYAIV